MIIAADEVTKNRVNNIILNMYLFNEDLIKASELIISSNNWLVLTL